MLGIGARGVGTDVNHIGSLGQHPLHLSLHRLVRLLAALGKKGVGCYVQNTHHAGLAEVHQPPIDINLAMYKMRHIPIINKACKREITNQLANLQKKR